MGRATKKSEAGTILIVTMVVVFLISVAVMSTLGGMGHQEENTRNHQFRLAALTAAASEISAQINVVNQNSYDEDDQIILDLLNTRGVERDYELDLGSSSNPVLTNPPHVTVKDVSISAEMARSVPCPGESIGTTKVLMGTIHARAELADTGIQSTQKQHFLYCWP